MENVYIALLHYPVYNKRGTIVTTAVTNMDIHDISRAARTYGVQRFYIITPLEQQQEFVRRILHHWRNGHGASYNPWRKKALDITAVKGSLEETVEHIGEERGGRTLHIVATGASLQRPFTDLDELKKQISLNEDDYLFVFGTGWGVAQDVLDKADIFIEPIKGPSDYNHLSVRSAVSIMLDRLFRKG